MCIKGQWNQKYRLKATMKSQSQQTKGQNEVTVTTYKGSK